MSEPEHEWFDNATGARFRLAASRDGLEIGWAGDDFRKVLSLGGVELTAAVREIVELSATVKALREERDRSIQALESIALLSRIAQIHKSRGGVEDWKHAERIAIEGGAKPSSPLRDASVPAVSAEEEP